MQEPLCESPSARPKILGLYQNETQRNFERLLRLAIKASTNLRLDKKWPDQGGGQTHDFQKTLAFLT